jgi:hypothetical protein
MRDQTLSRRLARAISGAFVIAAIGCSDGLETPVARLAPAFQVSPGSGVGPGWAGSAYVTPPTLRVWQIAPANLPGPAQRPAVGISVRFRVTAGGGSVGDTIVVTDETGLATCGSWLLGRDPGINTVTATVDGLEPVVFTTSARLRPKIIANYVLLRDPTDTTVSGGQLLLGDDGSLEVGLDYTTQAFIPSQPPVEPSVWTLLTYTINGSMLSSPSSYPHVYGDVRQDTLFVVRGMVDDDGSISPLVDTYVRFDGPRAAATPRPRRP